MLQWPMVKNTWYCIFTFTAIKQHWNNKQNRMHLVYLSSQPSKKLKCSIYVWKPYIWQYIPLVFPSSNHYSHKCSLTKCVLLVVNSKVFLVEAENPCGDVGCILSMTCCSGFRTSIRLFEQNISDKNTCLTEAFSLYPSCFNLVQGRKWQENNKMIKFVEKALL